MTEPFLQEEVVFDETVDEKLVADAIPRSGWLRDYVEWAFPTSEAPKLFHIAGGLSCLSAAVGRRAFVQMGHTRLYGNLFVALIGSQGVTRKSTALGLAGRIIEATLPNLLYSGDATPEALRKNVLNKNPERLLAFDELSTVWGPEYQRHIRQLLATLYDCPPRLLWSRVSDGDGCVERPTVSILSASTLSWLKSVTEKTDIGGGILSRFNWVVAGHDGSRLLPLPPEPDQPTQNRLVMDLKAMRATLEGHERKMGMDLAAKEHEAAYRRNMRVANQEVEESLGGFIARLASAHAPKIAMLLTLAEDPGADQVSPTIYRQNVIPLITLLERGMRRVVGALATVKGQEEIDRVAEIIRNAGKDGIRWRDLLRKVGGQSEDLKRTVQTLESAELVIPITEGKTCRYIAK